MKKISILILTLLVAMAACKKVPEVNKEYVDVERDLITVGTTTATIQCDYEYIATLKKAYLYFGEGEDAADLNVTEMSVVQKTLYVELAGLKENTTYSYYYEFVNGFNSMKSAVKAFKTETSSTTVTLPTVVTAEVTEITANSAKGGGEVTNDGGTEVTERGICWSTNANPTLNDNHIASGAGTGTFTAAMDNLDSNTTYHVRAYATNEKGTAYGSDREFTTIVGGGSGAPEGAINGLFTINENGDQVYFSQGNLQYQASTNTWRFAEHQWDFVGGVDGNTNIAGGNVFENGEKCDNSLVSSGYNGWIDLFNWATSGWNNGNVYYMPYDTEYSADEYIGFGYGPTDGTNYMLDLAGSFVNSDWGVYNSVSNGGNTPGSWRTLTIHEWDWLLVNRITPSGLRYAKAVVNGVNGVIILPDNWDALAHTLNSANIGEVPFTVNEISMEDWVLLEIDGAVFLPASGYRAPDIYLPLYNVGIYGTYWSSSSYGPGCAWGLSFEQNDCCFGSRFFSNLHFGHSVRLVCPCIQN